MSLSFGLDLDDALQNVTRAYQRASEAAVQVAKELWSPGVEASESEEEVAPELPEVEAARDVLRPAASLMLARHLKEHAELFGAVLAAKDRVAACAGEMLFGRPEEGAEITRFWLRRRVPGGLQVESGGLDRRPQQDELAEEEEEQQLSAHSGDAWLRILNQNDEPLVLAFRLDAAHGCGARSLTALAALCRAAPEALEALLLAAHDGPRRLRRDAARLEPRNAALLSHPMVLRALELTVEPLRDQDGAVNVLRVDAKVPLDFEQLRKHYQRVGQLLKHYDLLSVKAYDRASDACLYTFRIQEGWIHVCFHLMDGQLAWPSGTQRRARPVAFHDLQVDLEVQLSLLLMGLKLPAVALPKLFLALDVTAEGLRVSCREAGEATEAQHEEDWSKQVMSSISSAAWAAAESAASYAYDFQLLKRLLKEGFALDLGFEVSGDVATVRTAMDLAIPKSAAAEVVTQCLRQFLTEQLKKIDLLTLFRDFLDAISKDLVHLAGPEECREPSTPSAHAFI